MTRHPYRMAHPDPSVRFLAHRDTQPVAVWQSRLYRLTEFTVLMATLAVLVYAFFVRG